MLECSYENESIAGEILNIKFLMFYLTYSKVFMKISIIAIIVVVTVIGIIAGYDFH